MKTLTLEEWKNEGENIFGSRDPRKWKFKCSNCGNVQCYSDFVDVVEQPETVFFYSCLGRWKKGTGCDWTLGGLFRLHETEVLNGDGVAVPTFEFAEP